MEAVTQFNHSAMAKFVIAGNAHQLI
jgi:hypothetical protein